MTLALATMVMASNAQILKNGLLNGYKEGDKLEKAVYADKADAIKADSWSGAFSSKPNEMESPVVGAPLTYDGYAEGGPSIKLGYAQGVRGARFTTYSMTDGKQYAKAAFYLSCLVNISKAGNGPADFLGLSASHVGTGNRANIYVQRDAADKTKLLFGASLQKEKAMTTKSYEAGKTHLLVLKVDYVNQNVKLYVDPALNGGEPAEADCTVQGTEENVLKAAIRAITLRNRNALSGNIGNFRWSKSWDAVAQQ